MKTLSIIIGLLILLFAFLAFIYSLCRISGKSDEAVNQIFDNEL